MDIKHLKNEYEVVIVGGGIVGIGIFRDLSLHQIPTLLVEKGDYCSQTSQRSSKMLHGGIRYLQYLEFGLIKEALLEKNLWIKLAPHLAKEIPFYLPVFKDSQYPLWLTSLGLKFYDLLSAFQNSPSAQLSQKEFSEKLPQLTNQNLRGGMMYYDGIVDDAKLGLECLYDARRESTSHSLNYLEVVSFNRGKNFSELKLKDRLTSQQKTIKAREVIFACGPFSDQILRKMLKDKWNEKMHLSKGGHLWIKKEALPVTDAIVLPMKDNRLIFVIPQRDSILVGTTEEEVDHKIFNIEISQQEINYLLSALKIFFPNHPITSKDILSTFEGVRPLIRSGGKKIGATSRKHEIYHPYPNVHAIMGGKYTTFRTMGMPLTKLLAKKFDVNYNPQLTLSPLRQKSVIPTFERTEITRDRIKEILQTEYVRTWEDVLVRRLGLPSEKHWKGPLSYGEFIDEIKPLLGELVKNP